MIELQYLVNTGNTWTQFSPNAGGNCAIEVSYVKLIQEGTGGRHSQFIDFGTRLWGNSELFYTQTPGGDTFYSQPTLEGSTSWNADGVFINGELIGGPFSYGPNVSSFWLGAKNASGGDSYRGKNGPAFYGEIKFKNSDGDVVADYVPVIDDNGVVCFYDNVSMAYIYPTSGTYVAGPVAHTFNPDKSIIKFEQTGGTDTVTISAESDWTATTTDDWYTMDVTSGVSGDTVITISIDSETEVKREGSIHFEDADGYEFNLTIKQKGIQLGQPLHLGELEISTIFLGGENVTMAYLGEEQVYSSGPFVGFKVRPESLNFSLTSTEKTLKVKSSEEWELTTDADWFTFSQTSGNSGETIITVECTATEDATATIDFTAGSYSASVDASYSEVDYLEYIEDGPYVSGARAEQSINLNYIPTENTKVVLTVNMPDGEGNICFGDYGNNGSYFRLFSYSNQRNKMVFDIPNDSNYRLVVQYTWGTKATFEMGWAYLKNVDSGEEQRQTNPSLSHNWIYPLQLWRDMEGRSIAGTTGTKFYSIDIYEGNTKTMELRPALFEGEAGLWDNLHSTFYGNVGGGTITYGRF